MVELRVKGMVAAAPVLVLVLLLVATELVTTAAAEPRVCMSKSRNFENLCVNRNNCARVCQTEGFPDGACRVDGWTRRCFCKRPC